AGTVEVVGRRLPKGRGAAMAQVGFTAGYLPLPDRIRVSEYLRMYGELYGLKQPEEQVARSLERFAIPQLAAAMGTELWAGRHPRQDQQARPAPGAGRSPATSEGGRL